MFKIFGLLAGFIIFIACLGLLGVASYTAETRTKEEVIKEHMHEQTGHPLLRLRLSTS